jgi:hypothetical protein
MDIEMRIQIVHARNADVNMELNSIKNNYLREISRLYYLWEKQTSKDLRKYLKRTKNELKNLYRKRRV